MMMPNTVDMMIERRCNIVQADHSSNFPTICYGAPWFWGFNALDEDKKEVAILLYNALKSEVNHRMLNQISYDRVTLDDILERLPSSYKRRELINIKLHEWLNSTGFLVISGPEEDPFLRRLQLVDLEGQQMKPSIGNSGITKGVCDDALRIEAMQYVRSMLNNEMDQQDISFIFFEDMDLLEKITFIKLSELQAASYHVYLATKKESEKIKDEVFDNYDQIQASNIPNPEKLTKKLDRHVWDERIRTFPILMRQRLEQKQRGGHVKFIPQLSYKNQMINYDKDPHLSLFVDIPPNEMYNSYMYPESFIPQFERSSFFSSLTQDNMNWSSNEINGLYGATSSSSSRNRTFVEETTSPYGHHFGAPAQDGISNFLHTVSHFTMENNHVQTMHLPNILPGATPYRAQFAPRATSDTFNNSALNAVMGLSDTSSADSVPYSMGRPYHDTLQSLSSQTPSVSIDNEVPNPTLASHHAIPEEECRFFAEMAANALAVHYPNPLKFRDIEGIDHSREDAILADDNFTCYFNISDSTPKEISIKDLKACALAFNLQELHKAVRRAELADKLGNLLHDAVNNAIAYKFVNWICKPDEFLSLPQHYPQKFRLIPPETLQLTL